MTKDKVLFLYSAMRHSHIPWYAKAFCWITLVYIVSPIDFIPDFIPVIGLLDEIILVPIALWLLLKITPNSINIKPSRKISSQDEKVLCYFGVGIVVIIWSICFFLILKYLELAN